MKIVLDTTEIIRDPLLRGVQLQVLVEFAKESSAELLVPEAVIQEAMRHVDEKGEAAATEMRKAIRGVRLWLGSETPLRETEKLLDDAYRKSHVDQLRTRLQDLGVRILDNPPVSHTRLLNALRMRRRPFGDNRAGYQDALVWCTVVNLAKEHLEVVLITQNLSDFPADADGRPDLDLLSWLEEDKVPFERVRVYHSAEDFSTAVILPTHPLVTDKVQILAGKHPTVDLRGAISSKAAKIVLAAVANTPDVSLYPSVSEDMKLGLEELQLDVKEVSLAEEGICVVVACTFSINVSALRGSDTKFSVFDSWMKTLDRWLGDTLIISAELSFVFDRLSGAVCSFDVTDATVEREGRGQVFGSNITWRLGKQEPDDPVAVRIQGLEPWQVENRPSE